jgi:hypothetical protein
MNETADITDDIVNNKSVFDSLKENMIDLWQTDAMRNWRVMFDDTIIKI